MNGIGHRLYAIGLVLGLFFAVGTCPACGQEKGDAAKSETEQSTEAPENRESTTNTSEEYDPKLAQKWGADEYGMKTYIMVTLVTGKTVVKDPEENKKIFAGHFSNMSRLAKEGKLVLAGPYMDSPPKRGMFIFNVSTLPEAEKLVKTDPAVKAGVFDYQLNKLYCSAALMEINNLHKKGQKKPVQ